MPEHLGHVPPWLEGDELQRVDASGVNNIRTLLQLNRKGSRSSPSQRLRHRFGIVAECCPQTFDNATVGEKLGQNREKTAPISSSSENASLCLMKHVLGWFKEDVLRQWPHFFPLASVTVNNIFPENTNGETPSAYIT